jgi:hypothetical protein
MPVPTDTLLELTRWENDFGKQVTAEMHKNFMVNMCSAPRLNIACSSETAAIKAMLDCLEWRCSETSISITSLRVDDLKKNMSLFLSGKTRH